MKLSKFFHFHAVFERFPRFSVFFVDFRFFSTFPVSCLLLIREYELSFEVLFFEFNGACIYCFGKGRGFTERPRSLKVKQRLRGFLFASWCDSWHINRGKAKFSDSEEISSLAVKVPQYEVIEMWGILRWFYYFSIKNHRTKHFSRKQTFMINIFHKPAL